MTQRPRIFAGAQIRKLRKKKGLRQTELAKALAISPSYLSQLEHDDRPITARLADRLAAEFPIDWQDFALDETDQLAHALREALGDPVFGEPMEAELLVKLAEQQPVFARRFVELHGIYRRTSQRLEMVDEAISVDRPVDARLPWEEVRDWFHLSNNYVDEIDRSAEILAKSLEDGNGHIRGSAMRAHLASHHGVQVVLEQSDTLRSFDQERRLLRIDAAQPPSGIRFQLAYHLATSSLGDAIDAVVASAQLQSETARELLRVGLSNYAAGALLMPYERFRQLAREYRHDIDRISLIFRTSFEQTCHRLSTLQRANARGLPVFFCRVDMAGNITKRHSATQLQFARYGGACPLWIVHEAAAIPDRVLVQLAQTPDGERYVSMAKGLVKSSGRFDRNPRRYAVALGCEVKHRDDFVYADSIDTDALAETTKIGVSCRICSHTNCDQRAYPPNDQAISIDHFRRSKVPYKIDG